MIIFKETPTDDALVKYLKDVLVFIVLVPQFYSIPCECIVCSH